jgi:hypothetical protein
MQNKFIKRFFMGCLICLVANTALAGPFSDSFSPQELKGYLTNSQAKVLVAGGGEKTDKLSEAILDLINSFRSAGSALVMGPDSLGDMSSLSDQEIVAKAKPLPIEQVAIMRIFPGAANAPDTAVVTLYDKQGKALTAFSVQQGQPLAPNPTAQGSKAGVSPQAASSVSSVLTSTKKQRGNARDSYMKKRLHFGGVAAVNQYGQVVAHWLNVYEGESQRILEGDELFMKLGRKDLAESYSTKNALRSGLLYGGLGSVLIGGGLMMYSLFGGSETEYGTTETNDDLMYAGIGIMAVGSLVGTVGAFINPNPVNEGALIDMIENYNYSLKRDMGLEDSEVSQDDSQAEQSLPFALAPYVGPKGEAGLAFGMRF